MPHRDVMLLLGAVHRQAFQIVILLTCVSGFKIGRFGAAIIFGVTDIAQTAIKDRRGIWF
jgi:hypothetical protein